MHRLTPLTALLDSFAADKRYVPPHARRIEAHGELPWALEREALGAGGRCWRAWTDEGRIWFISGRLAAALAHEHGGPALDVLFYDADGTVVTSGIWRLAADGHWHLCEVPGAASRAVPVLLPPGSA